MSVLKYVGTFIAGVASGAAATYFFCKKHYDEIVEEEIKKARAHYEKILSPKTVEEETVVDEKESIDHYGAKSEELYSTPNVPYTNYGDISKPTNIPKENALKDKLFSITSDQFVNELGYDKVTVTYYTENEELVDDNNDNLNIADSMAKFLEEYVDDLSDVVYARDDTHNLDFEIVVERFRNE